jgi:hypothetical protein
MNQNQQPDIRNQSNNNRLFIQIPSSTSQSGSLTIPQTNYNQQPPRQTSSHNTPTQEPQQNHTQNHHPHGTTIPESSRSKNQYNPQTFSYYTEKIVEDGVNACQRSILGKIITEKPINVGSIQAGLDSIWGSPAGLKIQEFDGKIQQYFMNNHIDQERILLVNPWIFRNSWLVVKPWDRETDPRTIDFDHVPVWIQLWGLPNHCKTKQMRESIGGLLGKVEASELYEYPGKK